MIAIRWILLAIAGTSLIAWLGLVFGRHDYWKTEEKLTPEEEYEPSGEWPSVCAVIPARNEADALPETLPSLLNQGYPGELNLVLVDDSSDDGTGRVARELGEKTGSEDRLEVLDADPPTEGWSGKVWTLQQGWQRAKSRNPDLIWLTDADINHASSALEKLVGKLVSEELDMASIMADLRTDTGWEKFLIPNFVYFFKTLYPFSQVNNPQAGTAAAAGGCVLVRESALEEIGGFKRLRDAIIDDCSLARILKDEGKKLWLGLSHLSKSYRSYGNLGEIWKTISRSAFSQLNYSPFLLFGTVIGMVFLFLVPPAGFALGLAGLATSAGGLSLPYSAGLTALGGLGWLVQAYSFQPVLRWYGLSPYYGLAAPLGGTLYTLMTLDSAISWWFGKGSSWKGRQYG
ncbi:glycosyltransferase [Candidatus Bipolaricaulota bacterium]|nr:glycosyltransferase [Candidatus Bipolaricaulota bacterium]